jgi:hypothetical protein
MGRDRSSVTMVTLVLLGAILFGLAGCGGGGDDDAADEPALFDTGRAYDIARAALPTVEDLPGDGWSVEDEDTFDDDNTPPADTAACRSIATQREASRKKSDPERAGRAQREMAADRGDLFPISVDVQVNIFNSAAVPATALDEAKRYFGGGTFGQCFEDAVSEGLSEGVTVNSRPTTPSSPVPRGGTAFAVDITIRAEGDQAILRLEAYVWRSSNAGVTVTISGPKERLTTALSDAILSRVQERLEAQEGE